MGLEIGLWRAVGSKLHRITPTNVALETLLESYIESDPSMLDENLLIIGTQVPTADGGVIDVLALDRSAIGQVLELKRGQTARDVTAQLLDYSSWVTTLGRAEFIKIFADHHPGESLEETFYDKFHRLLPEEVNATHVLTIAAAAVDPATERIVRLLENGTNPISVAIFRHFLDQGDAYFVRAWLVAPDAQAAVLDTTTRKTKSLEPLRSDQQRSLDELTELCAARDRIVQRIRSCVDELRADPRTYSWADIADAIGSPSASAARQAYGSALAPTDEKVLSFWVAFVDRFAWDFLPGRFLYALYVQWMGTELPEATPLSKGVFARQLVTIAAASGEWFHTRSRPGLLMKAAEPLAIGLPNWSHDGSNEAIYGLRRSETVRGF